MKRFITLLLCLLLLMSSFAFTACDNNKETPKATSAISNETQSGKADLDEGNITQDKELGNGSTTIKVSIEKDMKDIELTIHTDKENLYDALNEFDVAQGEESQYGIFLTSVNGITANYETDQSYWSIFDNGALATTSIDKITIKENGVYNLVYMKDYD